MVRRDPGVRGRGVIDHPQTLKRSVRPRRFYRDERPIIAVGRDQVYVGRTGEIAGIGTLETICSTEPASIVVTENAAGLVADLDRKLGHLPNWQYRASPVRRRKYRQHRRNHPTESLETVIHFFGFVGPRNQANRFHMPLDPTMFVGGGIRKLVTEEEEPSEVRALYLWGLDVLEWCLAQRIKVTPRNGGIAAALLKDPRFYPEPRRKVPRATNDRAREHLPGNHYELFVPERTYHDAYYIDMQSAHHYAAARLSFPNANSLFARGRFREPPESYAGRAPWISSHSPAFAPLLKTHGLFLLRIIAPHKSKAEGQFPLPYTKVAGIKLAYVYSNELPLLKDSGVVIEGVEAAWTSAETESGLNTYAAWAREQVDRMDDQRKRWGKQTLLAPYGMLAARPGKIEFGFKRGAGTEGVYFTPRGMLPVFTRSTSHEIESGIVNVIHRGMIEAEIRKLALELSRELHTQGIKVLAIYADSVIIDSGGNIPLLPDPWRIKSPLSMLQFFNATSFDSREVTRLPGIPREGTDRLRRLNMVRAASTVHPLPPLRPREHVPRDVRRRVKAITRAKRQTDRLSE